MKNITTKVRETLEAERDKILLSKEQKELIAYLSSSSFSEHHQRVLGDKLSKS